MVTIVCDDLTNTGCSFVIEHDDPAEAKRLFYEHGATSPIHKEDYETVSDKDKEAFAKQLDEYLAAQEE